MITPFDFFGRHREFSKIMWYPTIRDADFIDHEGVAVYLTEACRGKIADDMREVIAYLENNYLNVDIEFFAPSARGNK